MILIPSQLSVRCLKVLEWLIAVILTIAILIVLYELILNLFSSMQPESLSLYEFLGNALTIVIGIEFVRMLILHTSGAVFEVCFTPLPGR